MIADNSKRISRTAFKRDIYEQKQNSKDESETREGSQAEPPNTAFRNRQDEPPRDCEPHAKELEKPEDETQGRLSKIFDGLTADWLMISIYGVIIWQKKLKK